MSKRKTYGNILMIAGLVLGVFLLTGSFIWMRDKSEMLLGVFVLILYGMGQWLTTIYWQRIQADWETTGETLARLQQAVTDIPAALDANLKAIATRLSENQQKALSQLQSEVSEGARQVLEKGVAAIGNHLESLQASQREGSAQAKALSESTATEIKALTQAMTSEIKSLAGAVAAETKALAGTVVAESKSLAASQSADAKALAASSAAEAKALASAQSADAKALFAAAAKASEESRAAFAFEAKRVLDGWEARAQGFEQRVLTEIGREAARIAEALSGSAETFKSGLAALSEASTKLIQDVDARAALGQETLVDRLSEAQAKALAETGRSLEAQSRLGLELAEKVADLAERMAQGSKDFQDLASLSRINQAEMQAGVGMLNTGLSSILERLEKQASAGDGYQDFLAEMGKALAAFQERAGEALMENALKTQEILMEVLNQAERKAASSEPALS